MSHSRLKATNDEVIGMDCPTGNERRGMDGAAGERLGGGNPAVPFGHVPPAPIGFEDLIINAQTYRMRISAAEADEFNLRKRLLERQRILAALEADSYKTATGFDITMETVELKIRLEELAAVRFDIQQAIARTESRILALGGNLPTEAASNEPLGRGRQAVSDPDEDENED